MKNKFKIIIIGGGASGLMAAVCAIKFSKVKGEEILIIEKNNELGKKLKITGGGRCNIFNAEYDTQLLLNNYGENKKFLHSAFSLFAANESKNFFKEFDIEVKIEDRKRAFPVSEKALDVYESMYKFIAKNNVQILLNTEIKEFILSEDGESNKNSLEKIKIINRELGEKELIADKYILSTGGYSHPETGSTGDGFRLLDNLNKSIKINKPNPSLVPLMSPDSWVHSLSGKSIENIKITIKVDNVKKRVIKYNSNLETKNRILFTHTGLSGPTILNLSKEIHTYLSEGDVTLHLDLFPELDESQLDKFILDVFDSNKNKKVKNVLNEIYPGNILDSIFEFYLSNDFLDKQVNDVKKEERKIIIEIIKNLKINISSLAGYDKAIIADGGVDCSEVNFQNMTLKKISNLAVTGDMLDISRPSGGYSLQLCWTTGFLATIK